MFDYHMHSKYSPDGNDTVNAIAVSAIIQNLSEIAITDHFDLSESNPRLNDVQTAVNRFTCLYNDIVAARKLYGDKINIKFGVELGQFQFDFESANEFISSLPFDFVIGSMHDLSQDCPVELYDYRNTPIEIIFSHYVDALIDMVRIADFDVVGHITFPIRYSYAHDNYYPDWEPFYDQLSVLFKEIATNGKGIEINCSGFAHPMHKPLPDVELLTLYKQCGGKILTIGSDAHRSPHVGYGINLGLEAAKQAGFTEITTFTNRIPTFTKITI